jgi:hypothetical protein
VRGKKMATEMVLKANEGMYTCQSLRRYYFRSVPESQLFLFTIIPFSKSECQKGESSVDGKRSATHASICINSKKMILQAVQPGG